jgi:hypothetical protein
MNGVKTLKDMDDENIRYHKVINHVIWKDKFVPLIEHSHTSPVKIYKPVTRKLKDNEKI